MAKKKMANYMRDSLINIAKTEVELLNPKLKIELYNKETEDKHAKKFMTVIKKSIDFDFITKNKETLQDLRMIVFKNEDRYSYSGTNVKVKAWLPQQWESCIESSKDQQALKDIQESLQSDKYKNKDKFNKDFREKMRPYYNIINSCNYIEDILEFWDTEEVSMYVVKKATVQSTALATLNNADVEAIKRNSAKVKKARS